MLTLVTQSVFVVLLLLCPWDWLAEFMEVEPMLAHNPDQTMFRIYLLLIPAIHFILAIAIEVKAYKPRGRYYGKKLLKHTKYRRASQILNLIKFNK